MEKEKKQLAVKEKIKELKEKEVLLMGEIGEAQNQANKLGLVMQKLNQELIGVKANIKLLEEDF